MNRIADFLHPRRIAALIAAPSALLLLFTTVAAQAKATGKLVVTPERLLSDYSSSRQNMPEPLWTPDGTAVVLTAEINRLHRCVDRPGSGAASGENDARTVWIAVIDAASGACRLLTQGKSPQISPDGDRVAFVAGSGADSRLAVIPLAGGTARDVSQRSTGIGTYYSGFAWSPDGARIAYGFRPEWNREADATKEGESTVVVIGGRGDLPPNSEIWIVEVESGERKKLLDQPARFTDLSWFPDGRRVLFMARGSFAYHTDGYDAEVIEADAETGATRVVVKDAGVQGLAPRLSPDGRQVAFMYDPNNIYYPYFYRVATIPVAGGEIQPLTESLWARGHATWAPDGSALYFRGKPGAFAQVYKVSSGAKPQAVTAGARNISSFVLSSDGRKLVWTAQDAYGRLTLRTASVEGGNERVLFDFTPEVADLALAEAEEIHWKSFDGLEIVGILVKPLNYQPGKRYPLIVDLHGGPLGGVRLAGRVLLTSPLEWQMWAAKGYAVLHADYRSSGIYGWDKLLAMRAAQNAAESDFQDIMAGVDHVIQMGIADPDRLGVIGHSAGAFRTNWIVTHTDRFKAAISYEGVADRFFAYGTGYRVGGNVAYEWRHNGKPWDVPENYRSNSAVNFVKGVTTPTMFVSGETGLPLFHNEMMYSAWKVQGVPAEFLVYGKEGHVISRPENQRDFLYRAIEWMNRWVSEEETTSIQSD